MSTEAREELQSKINELENDVEDLRSQINSMENKISDLQDELDELEDDEEVTEERSFSPEFVSAVEDLIDNPDIFEWERLELRDKLFTGELNPRDVLSRYFALGHGVPAAVYDQIKEEAAK